MPLRVAEKDGWLKAINQCHDCPHYSRMLSGIKDHLAGKFPSDIGCFHDSIVKDKRGKEVKLGYIPVWCPLPRDEGDGKITVTGDKIDALVDPHRPESLDKETK